MKFYLVIFLIFSAIIVYAQLDYQFNLDEEGKVYFDQVIEVEGVSKAALFLKGKDWFSKKGWLKEDKKAKGFWMENENIDNGEIFIDFDDKDDGKIFGRGRTNILVYNNSGIKKNGGSFIFRITALFKDGRTKIVIDELHFEGAEMLGVNSGAFINEDYPQVFGKFGKKQIEKQWVLMRKQAIKEFEDLLDGYKNGILKKDAKTDDW